MQDVKEFIRELFTPVFREVLQEERAKNATASPQIRESESLELLRQKEYLGTKEVQALFSLNPKTLTTWRNQGRGPAYAQSGGVVLYRRSDIEAWLKSNKKRTADQPGLK